MWRSNAFRLQALAIFIAALAMTTMLVLRDSVDERFNQRTAVALGGDLILDGTRFPDPGQRELLEAFNHTETASFASVLIHQDQFLLASVRAVSDSYPLYGELQISDERFSPPYAAAAGPQPGSIWLAGQALDRLQLKVGETLSLGERTLLIERVIVQEPDQQSGFYSMNPRAMIALEDLESTGVLAAGSRYHHNLLIAAGENERQALETALQPTLRPDQEVETVANTSLRERGPIQQLFLWSQLAIMLVVLLCAAAIFLTSRHRARQQQTLCAVMKTVGATQQQIARRLLGNDALALLLPALGGVIVAALLGGIIAERLQSTVTVPWPALLQGLIGPVVLWTGFAAPTLWQQLSLSPLSLLRGAETAHSRGPLLIALITPVPLALLLTGSFTALWPLLLLTCAVAIGLPVLLWPLVMMVDRLLRNAPLPARLAFRRLSRRKATTLPLLAALIISLSVLSMSMQAGRQLLADWQNTLPEQAPNYFVINLFDEDLAAFEDWLAGHDSESQPLYPVVRARLTGINDEAVRDAVTKEEDRAERALNRDLSLTESNTLPDSNLIKDGRMAQQPGEVTVESKLADSLGLSIGDKLTFTGSATPINATVTGLREVDWESFAPNFYFMFAEGTLEDQNRTWITSFFMPAEKSAELSQLVVQFPQISLLDVNAILSNLQDIVAQASQAAFMVGVLLMLAALLVLGAALLTTADQLRQDNSLLMTLGGDNRLLRKTAALQAFFMAGGAALLATLIHAVALWPLGERLFDGQLPLSYWLALPWLLPLSLTTLAVMIAPLKTKQHARQ
ncbi:ABC transporter permease [Alcanivorax sp. S6407]|uniref:ABC transporter permease n=1 Tax=Alcanivorax sp. S6407 TaxID=2926424 RepID=UPI001FF31C46|nr:FtsX-like permease family protein [Alcanivorax sp. S6407]MCK0152525.1 ABC transporter permease [Alcanivorax sp. S6407]